MAYIDTILAFLLGGGLIGTVTGFVTMKFTKKKAEAHAMMSIQDIYQELINDLREDKDVLKKEKDANEQKMSEKIDLMDKRIAEMSIQIETNNRDIRDLKPLKCLVMNCKLRKQ